MGNKLFVSQEFAIVVPTFNLQFLIASRLSDN